MPNTGVAPVHGPETRIGTGDPRAVAQHQAVRRLAEPAFRTLGRDFPAQAPRCRFHTSGSATGSPERPSNPDSGKAARTPHRMGVDRASGTRRSEQFPHLGDPAEAGLKAAHFRDRLVVHAEDGALDARGLAPRRGDGPGRMHGTRGRARMGPVPEDRPRTVERSPGARDPDGLDRQAILPQRPPRGSGAGPATNGAPSRCRSRDRRGRTRRGGSPAPRASRAGR